MSDPVVIGQPICPKTMRACMTPGMCAPFGGCRVTVPDGVTIAVGPPVGVGMNVAVPPAPTQPASAEQATVQPTTLQNAIAWGRLYDRAQALCAEIGYAGSVSTDDDEVELLMDALHAIDGGEWMPGLLPAVAAPAPSAEQQPVANRDTPALHEAARMALDALVALVPRVKHDATAREKAGRAIDALRAAIGEGEGN